MSHFNGFLLFILRKCIAIQKHQLLQRLITMMLTKVSFDPDDAWFRFFGPQGQQAKEAGVNHRQSRPPDALMLGHKIALTGSTIISATLITQFNFVSLVTRLLWAWLTTWLSPSQPMLCLCHLCNIFQSFYRVLVNDSPVQSNLELARNPIWSEMFSLCCCNKARRRLITGSCHCRSLRAICRMTSTKRDVIYMIAFV